MPDLTQLNVRLDPATLARLRALARDLGVSQADVIRLALRLLERRERAR